ncbi:hypothetical protein F2P56_022668 [Juglans regia]|uniref:Endonuclease/exonuclease/phosphatase domain-containing protein n=2 Tax=Juglans regia TaxID=51240 RepID=A0A833UTJ1_JUGRE|nr:uncharacterized protein LOC109003894 [Juglans regia]KAF5458655.1 hypothetical protein F2P56_022668 [Juglans regia]
MEDFRQTILDCNLGDLGYEGSQFTWCNNREGPHFTKERLDRALVNCAWQQLFNFNSVNILPVQTSDHNPLLVTTQNSFSPAFTSQRRLFRYEAAWTKQKDCDDIVKKAWYGALQHGSKADVIRRGLERAIFQQREWNCISRRNQQKILYHKREQLRALQDANTGQTNNQIHSLQRVIDGLLEEDDLKWKH